MTDISKNPQQFKELFKRYPKTFITADANYDDMGSEFGANTVNLDDIRLNDFEYEVGAIPSGSSDYDELFGPRNEQDRLAAMFRGRNGSQTDLDDQRFPQFNYDLPNTVADSQTMSELERLNKLLIK